MIENGSRSVESATVKTKFAPIWIIISISTTPFMVSYFDYAHRMLECRLCRNFVMEHDLQAILDGASAYSRMFV